MSCNIITGSVSAEAYSRLISGNVKPSNDIAKVAYKPTRTKLAMRLRIGSAERLLEEDDVRKLMIYRRMSHHKSHPRRVSTWPALLKKEKNKLQQGKKFHKLRIPWLMQESLRGHQSEEKKKELRLLLPKARAAPLSERAIR